MQGKRTNITKVTLTKILTHGLSPLLFAFTLLVGLILVNYIIAVKTTSYDVTKNKINTLSKETMRLLDDLNFDVTVKAFYPGNIQRRITILLDKYVKENSRIKVEMIDLLKNPLIARDYDVTDARTIIFEGAGRTSRIDPPPPGGNHNERAITIALFRLMSNQTNKVYFTTGHGELNIENQKLEGLSSLRERLIEQNYLVDEVNPLEEGAIPEDCTVLVIAGPTVPFTEEEVKMVKDFIDGEGNLMLMLQPNVETNLENLALYYGLKFGDDYIYETSSKFTTSQVGGAIAPFCTAQDPIEITDKLPNQNFLFPFVRSIEPVMKRNDVTVTRLLASSENSWAETDIESYKKVNTNQKPSRDENERKGPVTVSVVTEREFDLPDSIATRDINTYMVRSAFFGNANFLRNDIVKLFPSNINLFLNTINWVTRNEKIMDVTPNLASFTPVNLKQSQRRLLTWLTLVIFPASILFVGIVVWYRRR